MKTVRLLALCTAAATLAGCSTFDSLKSVGEAPVLTAINDPTAQAGYKPVNMPMPEVVVASYQPNSLFSNDARGFFKDQRAHKIGDILTVLVTIDDTAQMSNATSRSRNASNEAGVGGILGSIFGGIGGGVPGLDVSADGTISTQSGLSDGGNGSVNRKETLETRVAAVVTQRLPNGNLVIEGHQEVRVNFEVRDLIVMGIVRPEDINADNTIPSSKIAEARISYGGRGQITAVQQPRYGQQITDAILPF